MREESSLQELVEALQVDQSRRWRQGEHVSVEAYLDQYPQLRSEPNYVLDLLSNEMVLREESGERVQLQMYRQRFPDLASQLSPLVEVHRALESGALAEEDGTVPQTLDTSHELARVPPKRQPVIPGHEILGLLGQGGMGVVYKARHLKLKRMVAVKMIRAGEFAGPQHLQRFRIEAEAVARVQHPHIVQIHDVGEVDGLPYFSLEYVDGWTLAQKISDGPLPNQEAAELVRKLALAIGHAHQQGIIHRDLKPANVLLTAEGEPKVSDFGLAKQVFQGAALTQGEELLGTPHYMAPEQARGDGKAIGAATDIYALGTILYEALTGKAPFDAKYRDQVLDKVLKEEPAPPSRVQKRVARDLETICLKCLQKDPAKRYGSGEALAADLLRFLQGEPIQARRTPVWEKAWKWCHRRPAAAALCTVLSLAALAGLWYWNANWRIRFEYYRHLTNQKGILIGVGPRLSSSEQQQRATTYRVSIKAGKIQELAVVNAAGNLLAAPDLVPWIDDLTESLEEENRPCRFEFEPDSQGNVLNERGLDRFARQLYKFHYLSPGFGQYVTEPGGDPQLRTRARATHVRFYWNDGDGRLEKAFYQRLVGQPQPAEGSDGTFGRAYEYNDPRFLNMQTAVICVDQAGRPMNNRHGFARTDRKYDADGNLIELAYFKADGQRARVQGNFAVQHMTYDAYGNLTGVSFSRDEKEGPCLMAGYHRLENRYERGRRVATSFFNSENVPCAHGDGYAKIVYHHDQQGYEVEREYLDLEDHLVEWAGYAREVVAHSPEGTLVSYFRSDGKPGHRDGYASMFRSQTLDNDKLATIVEYRDEAGHGVLHPAAGYCRRLLSTDTVGRYKEVAYWDQNRQPLIRTDSGFHKCLWEYSDRLTIKTYFDGQGERMPNTIQGYAKAEIILDSAGNEVDGRFFDEQDRQVETFVTVDSIRATNQACPFCIADLLLTCNGRPVINTIRFELELAEQQRAGGRSVALLLLRPLSNSGEREYREVTIQVAPADLLARIVELDDRKPASAALAQRCGELRQTPRKGATQ